MDEIIRCRTDYTSEANLQSGTISRSNNRFAGAGDHAVKPYGR